MSDSAQNKASFASRRHTAIFAGDIQGSSQTIPFSYEKLKSGARNILGAKAYSYIAGGAGMESTIASNRKAFDRHYLQPRILRDVSSVHTGIELFGHRYPVPYLLAPVGVLELAHPQADLAVARAAATENIPFIFSSQASVSMEECAAVMGSAPRWFQLYWSKNNELVQSFVRRAEQCGCQAIVLTLDTTMLGWRPRDLDLAYLPFLRAKGIAQYTADPVFKEMSDHFETNKAARKKISFSTVKALMEMSKNYPGSFWGNLFSGEPLKAVQTFIHTYSRPSLHWDNLSFLRELTDLPILLKGILHPEDAKKAVVHGMNGIIVSNHGGRQVDGAVASLEVLPAIVQAVDGRVPVLLDSGIRTASDMLKALALGASAVLLGRPYVYALAIAGEQGVRELIQNYRAELELTMGLVGIPDLKKAGPDILCQSPDCTTD